MTFYTRTRSFRIVVRWALHQMVLSIPIRLDPRWRGWKRAHYNCENDNFLNEKTLVKQLRETFRILLNLINFPHIHNKKTNKKKKTAACNLWCPLVEKQIGLQTIGSGFLVVGRFQIPFIDFQRFCQNLIVMRLKWRWDSQVVNSQCPTLGATSCKFGRKWMHQDQRHSWFDVNPYPGKQRAIETTGNNSGD